MAAEDAGTKLARLLKELVDKREKDGSERVAHHQQQRAGCKAQLQGVPLVHATSVKAAHDIVTQRVVATRSALDREPSKVEGYMGIDDVVYASAGGVYPEHELAFVFSPGVEDGSEVEATPWDTGNLYARPASPGLPKPPHPMRRTVYMAHSLRAPEYRTYLVEYVASCFACADDYLLGADPQFDDPAGLMARGSAYVRSRSFEVRHKGVLHLESCKLLQVFIDEGATNGYRVKRLLQEWGVPFRERRTDDGTLVDQVRSWIVEYLTQERQKLS